MSKLRNLSLNKQIEDLARKWYIRSFKQEDRKSAMLEFKEDEDLRKDVIEQYLEKHPNVKKQYKEKKKIMLGIKLVLATTGLVVVTLGGKYTLNLIKQPKESNIEQETELDDDFIIEEQEEENKYKQFFNEVREINNTDKREDYITNHTKQIIVEKYNKANPDNQITADRLETLILDETVKKNTDRLGNYTYERISQNSVGEDLVKIGNIYDFRIDGKTVAVFDNNGDMLFDKNVEKQDMSFKEAITLVNQSERLKDIYKYPSNDYEKGKVEQKYQQIADEYSQDVQEINLAKNENEK